MCLKLQKNYQIFTKKNYVAKRIYSSITDLYRSKCRLTTRRNTQISSPILSQITSKKSSSPHTYPTPNRRLMTPRRIVFAWCTSGEKYHSLALLKTIFVWSLSSRIQQKKLSITCSCAQLSHNQVKKSQVKQKKKSSQKHAFCIPKNDNPRMHLHKNCRFSCTFLLVDVFSKK